MKIRISIVLLLCFISSLCLAFSVPMSRTNLLNQPESIAKDTLRNRYLISNWSDGKIIAVDSLGVQSVFNDDLSSVAGIKIYNQKLYCCERTGLGIIDLETGDPDTLISIEGAVMLNDLEFWGNYIFVSDYWDPKIYRINQNDFSYEVIIQESNFVPNGLCLDAENNRILAVVRNANGSQPRIMAFNPETGETSLLVNTPYYSLDGISRDNSGNWYISSWYISSGVQGIFKYPADFSGNPEIITTECDGPADILVYNHYLLIPNLNSDSLGIIDLAGSINNDELIMPTDDNLKIKHYPNPVRVNQCTNLKFKIAQNDYGTLTIYNCKGQLVKRYPYLSYGEHHIIWDTKDERNRTCSAGVYFFQLKCSSHKKSGKILIIK